MTRMEWAADGKFEDHASPVFVNRTSIVAMTIIFGIILAGAITGIYSGLRRQMNLEQWAVAGRGFVLIFVWLLMAGKVYTTFASGRKWVGVSRCATTWPRFSPGFADLTIQRLPDLTPAAWVAQHS